ncbi:MBL fold metallo-hydrolase RNA specificity domain-containing protein [Desulfurivibrio dismutans]|uniref:MBL fold metallo-hydrolase RNA specificity domain-containing protein n=1 Tax=Desulfurivibrio dismutans TaxID=1398908 RepID=UPI0023DBE7F2|nr:MBL fold metallo-hydrolase [Desulfurivibrio alkaliphilus]MDF1615197.1 MBL fold metallo-hydrolase [Desulfurivibrio alkaliphilus]
MKITFFGAAGTVTGSQHLIEVNDQRLLLDCGLFQGKRKESFELNRRGFCDAHSLDALVLSHAHIDHSGNIPCLVKNGFTGDIICTPATRDLCAIMLMDSAHIQEQDVQFVNKRRAKNGQQLFEPLYDKEDVVRAMGQFIGISPKRSKEILPGIRLTFTEAGHMLGSANVILDIHEQKSGRDLRLIFSGDIGRPGIPIIRDPAKLSEGADILIMESTYGHRSHPPYPDSEHDLERIVNETYQRGGCLLIPAFAVGRTQQLVYALHKLYLEKAIPDLPIYVDSPLATRATDIFRLHPEAYDREIRDFILKGNHDNPFGFDTLRYTQSAGDSKQLNHLKQPAIIISASGMMEGGRILHHLRNRITDPKNTILVTGWQAPNTLGRKIVEGQETVKIFGEEFPLKARVEQLTGFSGHADREGLLAWAGAMEQKPAHTFLVHGEAEASQALASAMQQELGFTNIKIPELYQEFEV